MANAHARRQSSGMKGAELNRVCLPKSRSFFTASSLSCRMREELTQALFTQCVFMDKELMECEIPAHVQSAVMQSRQGTPQQWACARVCERSGLFLAPFVQTWVTWRRHTPCFGTTRRF